MALRPLLEELLGADPPVAVRAYDGTEYGPIDAKATLVIRSPDALRRIVTCPGELGFARAYVAGDIEIEGDIYELFRLQERIQSPRLTPSQVARLVPVVGLGNLRPMAPPPEEMPRRRYGLHTLQRDSASVRHHYDVSNAFYRMVLGRSMTYSCAVFEDPHASLEEAQAAKHELICRKLGLRPGMRMLDVGCGWGSMVAHAMAEHGASAVGITLSPPQAELAAERAPGADIRVQDYRMVDDGPFDAISSVGMFEHVGAKRMAEYFTQLFGLVRPGGRLLNHAISRPAGMSEALAKDGFIGRYVFPDGELLEVGHVVSAMQGAGFEVRHVESLREHYARTLRHWVANLERHWDRAVEEVGANRVRIWHLYMAGSAAGFETGRLSVHQVLGVKPDGGESHMPLRPTW